MVLEIIYTELLILLMRRVAPEPLITQILFREKHKINEEIKLLRQWQERIHKELDRLQVKATKKPYEVADDFGNYLHKLRSVAQNEREFLASLSSSTKQKNETLRNKNTKRNQKWAVFKNIVYSSIVAVQL